MRRRLSGQFDVHQLHVGMPDWTDSRVDELRPSSRKLLSCLDDCELRSAGMLDKALAALGGSVNKLCLFLFPLYGWLMVSAGDLIVLLFTERFESSVDIFRIFLTTIPLTALALDY